MVPSIQCCHVLAAGHKYIRHIGDCHLDNTYSMYFIFYINVLMSAKRQRECIYLYIEICNLKYYTIHLCVSEYSFAELNLDNVNSEKNKY